MTIPSRTFFTGLHSLDTLLGCPLESNEIILIRGGPGTGKTTLSLQILSHHLSQGGRAGFLSLEAPPDLVLQRAKDNFQLNFEPGPITRCRAALNTALYEVQPTELRLRLDRFLAELYAQDSRSSLILIDSLNVLTAMLLQCFPGWPLRLAMHHVCQSIQSKLGGSIVLLTGETHALHGEFLTAVSESFLCDTEIVLAREPLFASTRFSDDSTRYDEDQCFCRVLKSRSARHQFRRCSYEITQRGLFFYDTYPGDGRLLLFAENTPQHVQLDELFKVDIPHFYPGLKSERFDRSSLQQILTSLRRLNHIPQRTDLHLASYDTYWIDWHAQLCQRAEITRHVKAFMGVESPEVVGAIHRACLNAENEHEAIETCNMALHGALAQLSIGDQEKLRDLVKEAFDFVNSEAGRAGIFALLEWEALRIFGERCSELIGELPEERYCVSRQPSRKLRCVPFNANVGLFVYRKDVISKAITDRKLTADAMTTALLSVLTEMMPAAETTMPNMEEQVRSVTARFFDGWTDCEMGPETWEEVVAIARLCESDVLIETATFDTFLATFFELLWAMGGRMRVQADYRVDDREATVDAVTSAIRFLGWLFSSGVVPRDATLVPEEFAGRYSRCGDGCASRDWVFARHWHSTLIDTLTAQTPRSRTESCRDFLWDPPGARLGVMPPPKTLLGMRNGSATNPMPCWGEWHLAIFKGSENTSLGREIVNWLLSSRKVVEAAVSGALLPTAESFYELYGDVRCFNVSGRSIESLPGIRFQELRKTLFPHARSRSDLFDYPHCARELHGLLEWARTMPDPCRMDVGEITKRVQAAFTRIEDLGKVGPLRLDTVDATDLPIPRCFSFKDGLPYQADGGCA